MKLAPPYDLLAVQGSFIDAWPADWLALAPPTELRPLSALEMNALGAQLVGWGRAFDAAPPHHLSAVLAWLAAAIHRAGGRAALRLSSRSPKDSLVAQHDGLSVRSAAQAWALLTQGSERVAMDLRMALDQNRPLALVVRRWIDAPPAVEWRARLECGHGVVAAVACTSGQVACSSSSLADTEGQRIAVLALLARLRPAMPLPVMSFDLMCERSVASPLGWRAWLLDANPAERIPAEPAFDVGAPAALSPPA